MVVVARTVNGHDGDVIRTVVWLDEMSSNRFVSYVWYPHSVPEDGLTTFCS